MADNNLLDDIHNTVDDIVGSLKNSPYLKVGALAVIAIIIGVLGVVVLPNFAPLITAFFAIVANVGIGLGIWYLIDRFVLQSVDTIGEIKRGNIAYAILVLSIILLIAAAIVAT